MTEIKEKTNSNGLGVNLIVNKSNIKLKKQLNVCLNLKVDFIITSLGNPKEIIEKCHQRDIKVFCDITDIIHAKKAEIQKKNDYCKNNNEILAYNILFYFAYNSVEEVDKDNLDGQDPLSIMDTHIQRLIMAQ